MTKPIPPYRPPLGVVLLFAALAGVASVCPAIDVDREVAVTPLRAAISDLRETFPDRYPRGDEFLSRLDRVASVKDPEIFDAQLNKLRRDALLANPLVSGQPILFVVRPQYKPDHHNTATLFQRGEINEGSFVGGGALKAIDLGAGGKVETLIEVPDGIVRDPEVHFDGDRFVFSMRKNRADDYHIYEMNAVDKKVTRLTSAPGVSDIDPIYLPDDTVFFSSTREPKFCMCNRHIMANLHRMEGDGANIHQVGKSTLFEGHASLLPDGRILYDRWEYVDRNFGDAQGLWTTNPDGTNHALYWGNNTPAPGGVIDARDVPGTRQVLCVFGSCHDRPWGALALVDRSLGLDGRKPVLRTWPAGAIYLVQEPRSGEKYGFDDFKSVNPKYEDPYPLSDKYFLCSRTTGNGEEMGIYLVDTFGNEILLHREGAGCYDPMPLGPRPRPPAIPPVHNLEEEEGTFYVADVYRGTDMDRVQKGAVKTLRVVESPEKRFWTNPSWQGQGTIAPAMNWHDFANKRILGEVPVEPDGSAHFKVPAGKFVYFQLLDEKGMMVQSMRSGTLAQPGETIGCVGCHDPRLSAPAVHGGDTPAAMRRAPSRLDGWYGPPRLFSYQSEVQPVFDKHCVECHDHGKEAGDTLNLSGDRTLAFNASYNNLWRKGYVSVVGAGPSAVQAPYAWGSHASGLVTTLLDGHEAHDNIDLSEEEFRRIVTWIDINAPYYPSYASAYPDNLTGRSPLDNRDIETLEELAGIRFQEALHYKKNEGPLINFTRPPLSPILADVGPPSSPEYGRALALIEKGAERLIESPRADMESFQPAPIDRKRDERYVERRVFEALNRESIARGAKRYDWD